jgi:hypothetical protein
MFRYTYDRGLGTDRFRATHLLCASTVHWAVLNHQPRGGRAGGDECPVSGVKVPTAHDPLRTIQRHGLGNFVSNLAVGHPEWTARGFSVKLNCRLIAISASPFLVVCVAVSSLDDRGGGGGGCEKINSVIHCQWCRDDGCPYRANFCLSCSQHFWYVDDDGFADDLTKGD